MPYPSMPCRRATPEAALRPFQGWPTRKAGGLQPSSTPLDTSHRSPLLICLFTLSVSNGNEEEASLTNGHARPNNLVLGGNNNNCDNAGGDALARGGVSVTGWFQQR
jgi:hypothetical protein